MKEESENEDFIASNTVITNIATSKTCGSTASLLMPRGRKSKAKIRKFAEDYKKIGDMQSNDVIKYMSKQHCIRSIRSLVMINV